ncbi:hypothetical protein [Neobacillus drentensis]|uniref:hypothetical protein n=1 Tax=Neobacillus drentensis TaxID=220684 RepID=UPI00300016B7
MERSTLTWYFKYYHVVEGENRIKKRHREGIDVTLKNSVQIGRPKAELTDAFKAVYTEWKDGRITGQKR